MSADKYGAYDFVLTIKGTRVGFICDVEPSGLLAYYESVAEKYAPQQRIGSFSYLELPPDVDVAAWGESWGVGAGYDNVRMGEDTMALQKYAYSRNVNLSIPHVALLSEAVTSTLESDGTAIGGTPTDFYYSPTYGLYALAGRYLYQYDLTTSTWVQRLDTASATILLKSMREYNSKLVVSAGSANDYYTSSNGTSFSAFTAEDENADYFELRGKTLYKIKGVALKATTDPTSAGWTGSDLTTSSSTTVTGMVNVDGNLYIFYRETFVKWNNSTDGPVELWRPDTVNAYNGLHPTVWQDGRIYVPYDGFLRAFDPTGSLPLENVFPKQDQLQAREALGQITAVAQSPHWLYVAVLTTAGDTYIWKGNPNTDEWHTYEYLASTTVNALYYVAEGVAHATNPVLLVGTAAPAASRVIMPRTGLLPYLDANCTFNSSGTVYGSYKDWGALAFPKLLNSATVHGIRLTAGNTVALAYDIDHADSPTTLLTAMDNSVTLQNVSSEVSFTALREVLTFTGSLASTTPVIGGFTLHAWPNPPRRRMWRARVRIASNMALNDGSEDQQDVRWVKRMLRAGLTSRMLMAVRDGSTVVVTMRDPVPNGIRRAVDGGEERDEELLTLTLVEVSTVTDGSETGKYGAAAYGGGKVYA